MERKQVVRIIKHCKMIDKEIAYNRKALKESTDQHRSSEAPEEVRGKVEHIQRENEKLAARKQAYTEEVGKLDFVKKRILIQFYEEGRSWAHISLQQHYSESWCRAIRDEALDELGKHMETNEILNILAEEKFN